MDGNTRSGVAAAGGLMRPWSRGWAMVEIEEVDGGGGSLVRSAEERLDV